ncbi:MAG: MotA/TolQ/ExbB proton channel family protein [Planctomycetota bacterium]|nr:MotA/TolQ/ExbB proton channel family protein [Planctomycetota bacterium]
MDIATILGLLTGLIMVASAMFFGGDALPFIHVPSLLITFGGTLAAVLIHFPAHRVRNAFSVARNCFASSIQEPGEVLEQFRQYAMLARRGGLLALETVVDQQSDPFLRTGLEHTASGCDPDTLKAALQREKHAIDQRHVSGRQLFEVMASASPAWGMIGTLIGLTHMLSNLTDPTQIGRGLALSLLTTLYGALFAHLICIPLAGKLESRHNEETIVREIMLEGFLALQEEHSPGFIEERLRAWIPPQQRQDAAAGRAKAA